MWVIIGIIPTWAKVKIKPPKTKQTNKKLGHITNAQEAAVLVFVSAKFFIEH